MTSYVAIRKAEIRPETRRAARSLIGASEHQEQAALVTWWSYACKPYGLPAWVLFAIPNGGDRHPAVAGKLKAEGVRAGIPDLMLAVPRGEFHGLFIEVKAHAGKVTPQQANVHLEFQRQGYGMEVCRGFHRAEKAIRDYLAS